jgi:two-component system response regulator BaeR
LSQDSFQRTVFVVEDDPKISAVLHDYLVDAGHRVEQFRTGPPALEAARQTPPALIILDLMLPGMDGVAVCKKLRQFSSCPVLMLTARVEERDRITGLDVGADDYVCKPFSAREVMARVAAMIRRAEGRFGIEAELAAPYLLDEFGLRAAWKGVWLNLSSSEYQILAALMKQPGRTFSRDQLLDQMGSGYREVSDRAIDSHIKNIRRKILAVDPEANCITSVYGVGYRWEP